LVSSAIFAVFSTWLARQAAAFTRAWLRPFGLSSSYKARRLALIATRPGSADKAIPQKNTALTG
jgi:hypothetical protein